MSKIKRIIASLLAVVVIVFPVARNARNDDDDFSMNTTENQSSFVEIPYSHEGFHYENGKMVRNPEGLVTVDSNVPEGYHLELYEHDKNFFYIVKNGYHIENGIQIKNGYHLKGNKIIQTEIPYSHEGFHYENGKMVRNPEGLVTVDSNVPEGYHLELYEHDEDLFYIVKNGYHIENGIEIENGYHIEGSMIVKDKVKVKN